MPVRGSDHIVNHPISMMGFGELIECICVWIFRRAPFPDIAHLRAGFKAVPGIRQLTLNSYTQRWKPRKIIAFGIIGIVFLVVIFAGVYINNIGFHNFKIMYVLSTTDKLIVPMDKEGHYLTREDRSVELLKERMSREGWSYVQQEGSNFFEKGNEEVIVTVQQWNHKYIIYQVKDNVINIAD